VRYFLDTEFIESGPNKPIFLLSLGIISDDNKTLYVENIDAPVHLANDWVKANVVPNLVHFGKKCSCYGTDVPCPAIKFSKIKDKILSFIGDDKPVFWGYFADYDWVIFCQTFGTMIDLPNGWPMYCNDLIQVANAIQVSLNSDTIKEDYNHNALTDAIWTKKAFEYISEHIR
jgi:hypothetical protein